MIITSDPLPTLKEVQKELLMMALRRTNGNVAEAAKLIGISVRTAYNWCESFKIDKQIFRESALQSNIVTIS